MQPVEVDVVAVEVLVEVLVVLVVDEYSVSVTVEASRAGMKITPSWLSHCCAMLLFSCESSWFCELVVTVEVVVEVVVVYVVVVEVVVEVHP